MSMEIRGLGDTRWAGTVGTGPLTHAPFAHRGRTLDGTKWTSTGASPMYSAPFGNKRRRKGGNFSGLEAIALPPAYIQATRPEHVAQQSIGAGQVPGLYFTLYALTPGPLVPQAALDNTFRTLLGQMGYDVSASTVTAYPLTYSWVQNTADKSWEAKISGGPDDLRGLGGFRVVYDPPTPKDLTGLPVTAEKYVLIARPKDGKVSTERVDALLVASRAARAALVKDLPNVGTELFLTVQGVPPAGQEPKPLSAGFGSWLGLLGLGITIALIARRDPDDGRL